MFQATLTSQRQMTVPSKLASRVGLKPGDKLNLTVSSIDGEEVIVIKKSSDWNVMRGILSQYKGKYPTADQKDKAWADSWAKLHLKNGKDNH